MAYMVANIIVTINLYLIKYSYTTCTTSMHEFHHIHSISKCAFPNDISAYDNGQSQDIFRQN